MNDNLRHYQESLVQLKILHANIFIYVITGVNVNNWTNDKR